MYVYLGETINRQQGTPTIHKSAGKYSQKILRLVDPCNPCINVTAPGLEDERCFLIIMSSSKPLPDAKVLFALIDNPTCAAIVDL